MLIIQTQILMFFLLYNCSGNININNNIIHNKKGNIYQLNSTDSKYLILENNVDFNGNIILKQCLDTDVSKCGNSNKYTCAISSNKGLLVTPNLFTPSNGLYNSIINLQWTARNGEQPKGGKLSLYFGSYSLKNTMLVENSNTDDCIVKQNNDGTINISFGSFDGLVNAVIETISFDKIDFSVNDLFRFTTYNLI